MCIQLSTVLLEISQAVVAPDQFLLVVLDTPHLFHVGYRHMCCFNWLDLYQAD